MCVTVRSGSRTRGGSLPYSGFVMDGGTDRTRPEIDVASLELHRRYRVDWKNEQLRRSFRFAGTLLSIEAAPSATSGEESARWLAFEVKPRFGKATIQRVDVATLLAIEPA
jgi:hypothetical protein